MDGRDAQTASGLRPLRWPRLWHGMLWLMIVGVMVLCLIPAPPDPLHVPRADLLYHLAGYALLSGWVVQLYAPPGLWRRLPWLALLGLAMEGVQALVPWRSADPMDALANVTGVALGALLALTPLARGLQWLERRLR